MKVTAMNTPRLKKTIQGLCLTATAAGVALFVAQAAHAQFFSAILETRRTLFAPFGQEMVHLEAPIGMCFLDETDPTEAGALNLLRDELKANSKQTLVAAFADCSQIASIGKGSSGNDLGDVGLVTWLNEKGEKIPTDTQTYFDAREATLPNHTRAGLAGYLKPQLDEPARRTENGISLGFTAETEIAYQVFKTVGVTSVSVLKGFPIDFMMTHTAKKPEKDMQELYKLMDKFLAQQVALNTIKK